MEFRPVERKRREWSANKQARKMSIPSLALAVQKKDDLFSQ